MNIDQLIDHAEALRGRIQGYGAKQAPDAPPRAEGARAQVCEFLRTYAGANSSFLDAALRSSGFDNYLVAQLTAVLDGFIEYARAGLHTKISPERRAQIDVVSDMLGQAQDLLDASNCHPAAAAVLIGASLEEFLRNWVESEALPLPDSSPSIAIYTGVLRKAELISKQDQKDITSWAGLRNHAAHGEWDKVSERERILLMLSSVNLFIRQKTS